MKNGQFIEINGKKLYVEVNDTNSDKAILYLHGGPGESCFDFTYHQTNRLGQNFRLIAFDQRGVCRSEGISENEPFGLDNLVEDCEELRRCLGIKKWSIIGHSFGGYLAVLYAFRYPNSIDKVIFEGPTFDFKYTAKALLEKTASLFKKYKMSESRYRCLKLSNDSSCTTKELVEGYMELSEFLEEKRMHIYTHNFNNPTDTSMYSDEQWDIFYDKSEIHFNRLRDEGKIFESALPLLKDIRLPCLLILGQYDVVTCPIQIETYINDIQQGEIYFIENCGHTPHYEAADIFRDVVTDFLTK
ncbi:alpha/beta hydrolase [Niallia circulans]|uniref:prolyl aminopeptidase n=1 Tax=Niallia circulans TaxID=1397 RepID=A0A0J1HM15_NIACI|nr:alpha/beta hydrolase [Niallia circulans]KLV14756.1 alpha/beta hydrolase [Niallia circulans]MED5103281.1 alpha/beta hydrolase [Niallia circulans]